MSNTRDVNWAIVGTGDIVRKRAGAAIADQPHSRIYACVTSPRVEAHREIIEKLAPEKVYTDLNEALADNQIDAVYVATPVDLHAAQAIAAMEAGKDVLLEKPMASTLDEAQRIQRVAEKTGQRFAVAYFRRHWERFQLVADAIQQGVLGQLVAVNVAVQTWYRLPKGTPGSWRSDRSRSGGGVLSDVGCHKLDLLAWWFGLPKRVVARVATRTHDFDVEDSAAILMTLADGTPVTATLNWNSKSWADEIHIIGTEGRLTIRPCDGDEFEITRGRESERRTIPPPANFHGPLVDDFARAIVAGRPPRFGADDGLNANRLLDAIFRSSERDAWVEVEQ
ncbi:MAG: Gfo/Idh/MocA family oxidoreductase [Pirellulales bacterium]